MIILSSMSTRLAQQLIDKNTGTEVWSELCLVYEERTSDATNSLKVYRLQHELHRNHLLKMAMS